jgi:hypothetical protein
VWSLVALVALAACTPAAVVPASPGALTLSPSSIAFANAGASYAQTVQVIQKNYTETFTASTTTCGGVATIAAAGSTTFTVTPVAAGSCSFTISGGSGQSATLTIGVTTTSLGGH